MALVFNSSAGTAGFNAYCSVAEATDYATSKLNTTFALLATATKEAAIIWASRQLDVLVWQGTKTVQDQPREWPRTGVWRDGGQYSYEDSVIYVAQQFDSTTIPQFLKDATADLALQLVVSDTTANTGLEGFKSIKVDTIQLEVNASDRAGWLSDSTRDLCWRWLKNSSKYNVAVQRVG